MGLVFPTDDQYRELANELQGCQETCGAHGKKGAIRSILEDLGIDYEVVHSQNFTDALEQHIFLCENCDIWHDPYVRVHNEIAAMTVCEECDEIISQ